MVGKENLPYLENPLNKLYVSFAEKGLSKDVVDKMLATSKDLGGNITTSTAKGIEEEIPTLTSVISSAAKSAENAFRKVTETHSPSKVYTKLGGYLMQGLIDGIMGGLPDVLKSLDVVSTAMFNKMNGLSFNIPTYTAEDVDKAASGAWRGAWVGGMQSTAQTQYQGADPQALTHASQIWSANGQPMDVNVNVQSYVELDGEQVGTAVSHYQQQQMAYSNGR